jgi:hypothetical protein
MRQVAFQEFKSKDSRIPSSARTKPQWGLIATNNFQGFRDFVWPGRHDVEETEMPQSLNGAKSLVAIVLSVMRKANRGMVIQRYRRY